MSTTRIDYRELNYIAIEQIIESGIEPLDLLKSLIKSMGSDQVNDHLAYICRVHGWEIPCGKVLAEQECDVE